MKRSAIIVLLAVLAPWTRAEEGMWTFDNPPNALMKASYGFEITNVSRCTVIP